MEITRSCQLTLYNLLSTGSTSEQFTQSVNVAFRNYGFYGTSSAEPTYDSAFINSLTSTGLISSKSRSLNYTIADSEKYMFYAYPSRFGICRCTWNGWPYDLNDYTVTVTNSAGYS